MSPASQALDLGYCCGHHFSEVSMYAHTGVTVSVDLLLPIEDQDAALHKRLVEGVVSLRHQRLVYLLCCLKIIVGEEPWHIEEAEEAWALVKEFLMKVIIIGSYF